MINWFPLGYYIIAFALKDHKQGSKITTTIRYSEHRADFPGLNEKALDFWIVNYVNISERIWYYFYVYVCCCVQHTFPILISIHLSSYLFHFSVSFELMRSCFASSWINNSIFSNNWMASCRMNGRYRNHQYKNISPSGNLKNDAVGRKTLLKQSKSYLFVPFEIEFYLSSIRTMKNVFRFPIVMLKILKDECNQSIMKFYSIITILNRWIHLCKWSWLSLEIA